jgi:hypothetical protein
LVYPCVVFKNSFIDTFNELIDIIHKEDPNHPVGTAIGGVSRKLTTSVLIHSPQLDLLSFNLFGRLKDFDFNPFKMELLFGSRPYYISEWGSNGHWESEITSWKAPIEPTSAKKAEQIRARNNIIIERKDQTCLGDLVFYWGQKQEITQTWFSIFDAQGNKSQTFYELQSIWKNQSISIKCAPQVKYMLVNNKGVRDRLIYTPNEIKVAEVFLDGEIDSTLHFIWEIYEENWDYKANVKQKNTKKILDCFDKADGNKLTFRTPAIEGPYRIFVFIYDQKGNFATTNTPFYILNNK